jgi:hypothetical protein
MHVMTRGADWCQECGEPPNVHATDAADTAAQRTDDHFFDAALIPQNGPAPDAEIIALRALATHVAAWANSDEVDTRLPYRNQGDVLDALLNLSNVYAPGAKP